jgi:hypothetical protein
MSVVLALAGCTCTSDGLELDSRSEIEKAPVTLEWRSTDSVSGSITALSADGRQFRGEYLRITPDANLDQLTPLWEGWTTGWGWPHWRPEAAPKFVKHHDGEVLASLTTASGERMRCRFGLDNRSLGMSGGGKGECEFAGGKTIDARISPLVRE